MRHHADALVEEVTPRGHHMQCVWSLSKGEEYGTADQAKSDGNKPILRAPCVAAEILYARPKVEGCSRCYLHRRGADPDWNVSGRGTVQRNRRCRGVQRVPRLQQPALEEGAAQHKGARVGLQVR